MNSQTLICAYGKNSSVESVFERLFTLYLSNYSRYYTYGALIDLPDSVCYRSASDFRCEEMAQKCIKYLNQNCDGKFFCAIRQRRYVPLGGGYIYSCDGGVMGALKSIWKQIKGTAGDLFPIIGQIPGEVERLYFSCYGEDDTNEASTRFSCIEPRGVFKLGAQLGQRPAVFPLCTDGSGITEQSALKRILSALRAKQRSIEGLYSEKGLDALLSINGVGRAIMGATVRSVRLTSYKSLYVKKQEHDSGVLL